MRLERVAPLFALLAAAGCHNWDEAAKDCTLENGCLSASAGGGNGGPTVPSPPQTVTATAGVRTAHVKWAAPATNGGSEITGYAVFSSTDNRSATVDAATLETDVTDLTDGTTYTFTVTASNGIGVSMPSDPSNAVKTASVPGAPTSVSATAGNAQAVVTWAAPLDPGTGALSGYTVTSTPGGINVTAGPTDTQATVMNLVNGTSYTFIVRAANAVGTSLPSMPSNAVTPATVPTAPLGVIAIAGNAAASVTWTAPIDTGGMPITSYTVAASPGPVTVVTANGATTMATVTGLTNGTPYTFTVKATNALGSGPASLDSNSIMPLDVPGPPTAVSAIGGNAQATVSWTAPQVSGGSALTGYKVTSSPGGITIVVGTSPMPQATVSGLTNGTAYTFSVKATNSTGDSLPSLPSNAVTPATVPDPPTSVMALAGNTQATVSWQVPANTGGSPITGYTVTSNPGNFTANVSASPATVNGLMNGTSYTFTVTATNAVGASVASSPSTPITPAAPPGVPTAVSAVRGDSQATVQWTAPLSNGGNGIISYTATSSPGGVQGIASGGATMVNVVGLTNGQAYTFTVHATNMVGPSSESTPSSPVTPAGVPTVPLSVTAVPFDRQATVGWSAPASANGTPVIDYTVTSTPGNVMVTTASTSTPVSGLANGTSYTFTVKARNAVGPSLASMPSAAVIPFTVPDAPASVTATFGNMTATVMWPAPFDEGRPITSYTVSFADGGTAASTASTMATVPSLVNGQSYTFTVKATNVAGTSLSSPPSNAVVPSTVPTAPRAASALVMDSKAAVNWLAPASNGGAAITGYTVTSTPGNFTATVAATARRAIVSGLTNGTSYTFTVVATNLAGNSPTATTNAIVPEVVCTLTPQFTTGTFGMDAAAKALALGDLDGDGILDLVTASGANTVRTYHGSGTGTFVAGPMNIISATYNPGCIFTGDFTSDFNLDVGVCSSVATPNNNIALFTGAGDGMLIQPPSIVSPGVGTNIREVVAIDLDGDGKLDFAMRFGGSVFTMLGHGDGTFGTGTNLGPGAVQLYGIAVADFNGDGKLDIAATPPGSIATYLGNGNGTFMTGIPTTATVDQLATGDFNQDGKSDLVTGSTPTVSVLLSNGNGTFGTATTYPVGGTATSSQVATADMNGDGNLDIVLIELSNNTLGILLGTATGTFGTERRYPIPGATSFGIGIGDFNGDGKLDVVTGTTGAPNNMSRFIRTGCM